MEDRELDVLQLYLDELEDVEEMSEIEEAVLLDEYIRINAASVLENEERRKRNEIRNRLIEANLKYAMSFAKDYLGRGAEVSDILAEINLALTSAVDAFYGGDLKEQIKIRAEEGIEAFFSDEDAQKKADGHLIEQMDALMETARILAMETGREASVEELAVRMGITPEEAATLMQFMFSKGEEIE